SPGGIGGGGGLGGLGANPLQTVMSLAQLLMMMNSLNSSDPSGSSGSGSGNNCVSYHPTQNASNTDPCAYYNPSTPSVSSGFGTETGGNTQTPTPANVSELFKELYGLTGSEPVPGTSGATTTAGVSTGTTTVPGSGVRFVPVGSSTGVVPIVSGDVRYTDKGITVIVNRQGTSSSVAGFYGSEATTFNQQQGLFAAWCRTRPWASNFLSKIIPPTFFDSLCTLRGYRVGDAAVSTGAPTVTMPVSFSSQPVNETKATSTFLRGPKPEASIWAIPPAVKLGGRTTVFWSSKNVSSCIESSTDGSFTQNTLSGGAATVALSGPTTFSISCEAADGTRVTDYVVVSIGN
ncbi:MAG: hypothetical protein RIQ56_737, partial [Candidatus Parcubacteria bacterium]